MAPRTRRRTPSMAFVIIILVSGRIVNLFVPLSYKNIIDNLGGAVTFHLCNTILAVEPPTPQPNIPIQSIFVFVGLRFLSGGSGLLSNIEDFLWVPIAQHTTQCVSVKMFSHLHDLSMGFHLNRKTGEILRVQDRGVESIVSIVSSLLFNIFANLADILIAVAYFTVEFDSVFGCILFFTMSLYIFCTIYLTEWRTKFRRVRNDMEGIVEARAVDSLLNFETVKNFGAEEFEVKQYTSALKASQTADLYFQAVLFCQNVSQNAVIHIGLFAGCLLCAQRIFVDKSMTAGDFVLFLSYMTQLYGPLSWFASYYRVVQRNLVDMEKMLDLMNEPVEIQDHPDAQSIASPITGEVEFRNVTFSYDHRKLILSNISFYVKPGQTVAFVGPSGSGKSTIFRLIFRFYDVTDGKILIDGQDIRLITQKSLRSAIGVVPQDTVLFNDSIEYNISYGKPGASRNEIEKAAIDAQIHDKIILFPEGYNSLVGERGLKLSGGEKQRVAISRTLLKNPPILLLDEATSALDTKSESALQSSLMNTKRTTLIIAHRLSTITHADQILVLKDGVIIERGSHDTLLLANGEYRSMWLKQLKE